jgi:CO/xanthine dehydrogenase Mo-binding subunit
MVVGGLLERCAAEMKQVLGRLTPREYLRHHGPLVVTKQYEAPTAAAFDETTYRGDAYGTYAWACDVAEVEFDPVTYEVRPVRVTAVQDIGKALNPVLAAGQIEGGTVQGLGYALLEEVVMRDGRMANAQLTNYIVPTTMDAPRIDVVIVENAYRHGPFGAKGVGELPFDGAAPAIANAVRHLGFDVRSLPLTPERIMAAAQAADDGRGNRQ